MRRLRVLALMLVLDGAGVLPAQQPSAGTSPQVGSEATAVLPAKEQQKAAPSNPDVERQKKLAADVEHMLVLATELKQAVDKTDKNTLSIEVLRKADELEKLARSVKERTRTQQ